MNHLVRFGWTHVVLYYPGPDDGIEVFMDGVEVVTGTLASHHSSLQLEMAELLWKNEMHRGIVYSYSAIKWLPIYFVRYISICCEQFKECTYF